MNKDIKLIQDSTRTFKTITKPLNVGKIAQDALTLIAVLALSWAFVIVYMTVL